MADIKETAQCIFVTGATGFLGAYTLRYLLRSGYSNLYGLRRKNSENGLVAGIESQIHWLEGDILDIPFLEKAFSLGFDVVIHCAAVVSFYHADRKKLYDVNVTGTECIVNMCLAHGVKKLIHVSSIAALGRTKNFTTLDETNKWVISDMNSYYGVTKYQAEQEVWRGAAEGLNVCIINPAVILGAQYWAQGSGKLFEQVQRGLKLYTPGGTGYVDVRDVAQFLILLLESDIVNERFVLSSENRTYKTIFESIADALHKSRPKYAANAFLRAVAWRLEWLRSVLSNHKPLITRETARSSATTYYFNNAKSLKVFPTFKYTPVEKSVADTANVYLKSLAEGKKFGILNID